MDIVLVMCTMPETIGKVMFHCLRSLNSSGNVYDVCVPWFPHIVPNTLPNCCLVYALRWPSWIPPARVNFYGLKWRCFWLSDILQIDDQSDLTLLWGCHPIGPLSASPSGGPTPAAVHHFLHLMSSSPRGVLPLPRGTLQLEIAPTALGLRREIRLRQGKHFSFASFD